MKGIGQQKVHTETLKNGLEHYTYCMAVLPQNTNIACHIDIVPKSTPETNEKKVVYNNFQKSKVYEKKLFVILNWNITENFAVLFNASKIDIKIFFW